MVIEVLDIAVTRAQRAVYCSPFTPKLLQDLGKEGIALRQIAGKEGVQRGYLRRSLALRPTENALLWLIQVGVLRREVDGQGITDSFRLTPLGHELVRGLSNLEQFPVPAFSDRIQDFWLRWSPDRWL